MSTEPATWRDLRAELNANQIAELEELESNSTVLTDDHLLDIARSSVALNLADARVGVAAPPDALWVGHWWTSIGGEKTREYAIVERSVGDTSAELRGMQRVDGSTAKYWITVGGDDPHLTVKQARRLAFVLHELAVILEGREGTA